MQLIGRSREAVWRVLEWSFVMGVLAWLFVQMWSDSFYDRRRRRPSRSWLQRLGARLMRRYRTATHSK